MRFFFFIVQNSAGSSFTASTVQNFVSVHLEEQICHMVAGQANKTDGLTLGSHAVDFFPQLNFKNPVRVDNPVDIENKKTIIILICLFESF